MIEDGLAQLLGANSTVSSAAPGGLSPVILPDTTFSATTITYRTISSVPTYAMTGAPGMVKARIEYTAWGQTYAAAKAAVDAIRTALDAYSGTLPNGVVVQYAWRDGSAVDAVDEDTRLYMSSVDYRVIYVQQ